MRMMTKLLLIAAQFLNIAGLEQLGTWYEARNSCSVNGGRLKPASDAVSNDIKYENLSFANTSTEFWTGDYTVLSDWISIDGCYQSSLPDEWITNMTFEKCQQTCNNKFICKYTDLSSCTCVPSNYSMIGKTAMFNCIRGNPTNKSLIFNGHNSPDIVSGCNSCNTTKIGIECQYNPYKEKYRKIFQDKRLCSGSGTVTIIIFRINTSHIDDGSINNFNSTIKCGFINCINRGQGLMFENCSKKKNYFCYQEGSKQTTPSIELTRRTENATGVSTVLIASTAYTQSTETSFIGNVSLSTISRVKDESEETTPNIQLTRRTENATGVTTVSIASTAYTQSINMSSLARVSLSSRTHVKETIPFSNTTEKESRFGTKSIFKEQQSTFASVEQNATAGDEAKDITGPLVGGILGVVLIVCLTVIAFCKYRKTGLFRKQRYADKSKEMNNLSHAITDISEYHDVVPNSNNGVENDVYGIDNMGIKNTASLEIEPETSPNNVYAVVSKKHTPKSKNVELAESDSQQGETEGEYDILNNPLDRGENQLQHNVYESCQGIRSDTDPTYNTTYSARVDTPNDDAMYDHTFNVSKM